MKEITDFFSTPSSKKDVANGKRPETGPPKESSTVKNAFQVMMDSRNKIIGSNSPGKDLPETTTEERPDVEKLSARKKLFNGWVKRKEATKRVRDDEDRDEVIRQKMKKRAKRLKKLLKVENDLECSSDDSVVHGKTNKKKVRVLSTTSEDSDIDHFNAIKGGTESSKPTSSPLKPRISRGSVKDSQPSLLNFVSVSEKGESKQDSLSQSNNIGYIVSPVKSSKRRRRRKRKCKGDKISGTEESRQLTPSSRWRMRIKLNLKDDSDFETSESTLKSDSDKGTISLSSESDEDFQLKSQPTTLIKLAPVFSKSLPKPKLDPDVIEARKQFLMSGNPAILKKVTTEQRSFLEKEVELFPKISHVQQKCESALWCLPKVELQLLEETPLEESNLTCIDLTCKSNFSLNIKFEVNKVDKLKKLLDEIKHNNPNYPVYRSFRLLHEKSRRDTNEPKPNKKKGKRLSKSKKPPEGSNEPDYSMWTEKYRPRCSDDILGNSEAVKGLKRWLEVWKHFSQELNSKRRRRNSSGSDFESTDCDSRDSVRFQGNALVVGGPCGSGKSSAVYAVCEELGLNVIEVNASSKRTGRKLMQELQEATQSHQVRKNELASFLDRSAPKQESNSEHKMCVLLVEDVDIVFEQDEGFVCALNQLINTSKRPIIMTTTDHESASMKKLISDYEFICFSPLHSSTLATWLQVLCLIEGRLVNRDDVGNMLDSNRGDVRKTLLELQFWVQSGGQLIQNEMPVKIERKRESCEENFTDDEDGASLKLTNNKSGAVEHRHCVRTFQIFQNSKAFNVPYYLNLGFLYWNIPNILNFNNKQPEATNEKTKLGRSFKTVLKLYDSLCAVDVVYRRIDYSDQNELVKDSLELTENFGDLDHDREFVHELNHTLVDGLIKEYNSIEEVDTRLEMGVPSQQERKRMEKHRLYENVFKEAIGTSSCLDRKSISLDYLPALRAIARAEAVKMANNTKRGKRFRSYFRTLGVNCNESTMKLACSVLHE